MDSQAERPALKAAPHGEKLRGRQEGSRSASRLPAYATCVGSLSGSSFTFDISTKGCF